MTGRALAIAAVLALSPVVTGCVTTGTIATAEADTTKALIVADNSYHLATVAAIALAPSLSAGAKARLAVANDKAAAALHDAYSIRTSAAVADAVAAITTFQALAGAKP